MKEHLLHFIWQNKLFNTRDLKTTDGNELHIADFGKYNKDGGPDFHNARIKIEDVTWAGNIELHIYASDWKLHKHHHDKKYDNVILHVVYFNDEKASGIPTLELNGRISALLLERYEAMMLSRKELICENLIDKADEFTIENWKERLVIERLERKSQEILSGLFLNNNNWEQTAYQLSGKYFGSHINKEPFEMLTRLLDHKTVQKHAADIFQLEALLFGTAGFLNKDFKDAYPAELKKEYHFLKHKYRLKQLEEHQWQFLRIRPVSFPTIRIAWFAQLMKQMPLFDRMISLEEPAQLLEDIEVSRYWNDHYVFDHPGRFKTRFPGTEFRAVLQINVFVPLLYAYGRFSGEDRYIEKALELLLKTPPEENVKTRVFKPGYWTQPNAFHTQATIELYDHYCTQKRCTQCSIGHKILRGS